MILADALFSFLVALLLAVIYAVGFRRQPLLTRQWWVEVGGFFALLFLGTWGGGVWLATAGAAALGAVAPFIAVGMILGIFMMASATVRAPPTLAPRAAQDLPSEQSGQVRALFVWVLMLVLAAVIFVGYAIRSGTAK